MITYEQFKEWHTAGGLDTVSERRLKRAYEIYTNFYDQAGEEVANDLICGHEIWKNQTVYYNLDDIVKHAGDYIQFDGIGIISGLADKPSRYNTYKIIGSDHEGNLIIKGHRSKRNSILPVHNQNQKYKIIPADYLVYLESPHDPRD